MAWGDAADWYRNLLAGPAVELEIGRLRRRPETRFLETDELSELLDHFSRRHPLEARLAPYVLGWRLVGPDRDLRGLATRLRAVAFRLPQRIE